VIRVNVNGRLWELGQEVDPEWPFQVEKDVGFDGLVLLNDNEKSDYLTHVGFVRGSATVFFYGIEDGDLYYLGEDPSVESDQMVIESPYRDAEYLLVNGGTAYWSKPVNFDIGPFKKKVVDKYDKAVPWAEVDAYGDKVDRDIGESAARLAIDNLFLQRDRT